MSFAAMMEQLKEEYIQSLPEKIELIEAHLQTNSSESLREDFHKLKGTGKTYGIPEISTLAASVEEVCISSPQLAATVAQQALPILRDIYASRSTNSSHDIGTDERYIKILQTAA